MCSSANDDWAESSGVMQTNKLVDCLTASKTLYMTEESQSDLPDSTGD